MGHYVEEDPYSRYVDYTNATVWEDFTADVETALRSWGLADAGSVPQDSFVPERAEETENQSSSANLINPSDYESGTERVKSEAKASSNPGTDGVCSVQIQLAGTPYRLTLLSCRESGGVENEGKEDKRDFAVVEQRRKSLWGGRLSHLTDALLAVADSKNDFSVENERRRMRVARRISNANAVNNTRRESPSAAPGKNIGKIESEDEKDLSFASEAHLRRGSKPDQPLPFASNREKHTNTSAEDHKKDAKVGEDIRRWFGVEECILLSYGGSEAASFMSTITESEARKLQSSLSLALINLKCSIPAFVRVHEENRNCFIGSSPASTAGCVAMNFETDVIAEVPPSQGFVSGLIDFFRLKLKLPSFGSESAAEAVVMASILFSYYWDSSFEWHRGRSTSKWRRWVKESPHWNLFERQGKSQRRIWGPERDPLVHLHLEVLWKDVREGSFVDNSVHSTLDPLQAHSWRFYTSWTQLPAQCPLSDLLLSLLSNFAQTKSSARTETAFECGQRICLAFKTSSPASSAPSGARVSSRDEVDARSSRLMTERDETKEVEASSTKLSRSAPGARAAAALGSALGSFTTSLVQSAVGLKGVFEEVHRILYTILDPANSRFFSPTPSSLSSPLRGSAPPHSLTSFLAIQMAAVGDLSVIAILWYKFVKALHRHWEDGVALPFMKSNETLIDGYNNNDNEHSGQRKMKDNEQRLDGKSQRESRYDVRGGNESIKKDRKQDRDETGDVSETAVDLSTCLLHQKLQMLNFCIEKRINLRKMHLDERFSAQSDTALNDSCESLSSEPTGDGWDAHDDDELEGLLDSDGETGADTLFKKRSAGSDEPQPTEKYGNSSKSDADSDAEAEEFFDTLEGLGEEGQHAILCETGEMYGKAEETIEQKCARESRQHRKTNTDGRLAYEAESFVSLATGKPIRVPQTQSRPPLTLDMIEEQQEKLISMGASEEASLSRQQLQTSVLLSDMEAFKAANPGCVLADFVRWHSPRDFIEWNDQMSRQDVSSFVSQSTLNAEISIHIQNELRELQQDGTHFYFENEGVLSNRMRDSIFQWNEEEQAYMHFARDVAPKDAGKDGRSTLKLSTEDQLSSALDAGQEEQDPKAPSLADDKKQGETLEKIHSGGINPWRVCWRAAKAVPADRQRPLFDASLEAKKVLRYFTDISQGDLLAQLLPASFAGALSILCGNPSDKLAPSSISSVQKEIKNVEKMCREAVASIEKCVEREKRLQRANTEASAKPAGEHKRQERETSECESSEVTMTEADSSTELLERMSWERDMAVEWVGEVGGRLAAAVGMAETVKARATSLLFRLPRQSPLVEAVLATDQRGITINTREERVAIAICLEQDERGSFDAAEDGSHSGPDSESSEQSESEEAEDEQARSGGEESPRSGKRRTDRQARSTHRSFRPEPQDSLLNYPQRREVVLRYVTPTGFHSLQSPTLPVAHRFFAAFTEDSVRFALAQASAEF